MQVTDEQRRFFDTFGFCRFRKLFKPDEAAAFPTALEGALARARDGAAFAGEERQAVVPFIECDPSSTICSTMPGLWTWSKASWERTVCTRGGRTAITTSGTLAGTPMEGCMLTTGSWPVPARQGRFLSRPGERGERLPQRPTRQPRPELRRLHLQRAQREGHSYLRPRRPRALPSGVNARRHDRLRFAALAFLLRRSHRAAHVLHELRSKPRRGLAGYIPIRLGTARHGTRR